MAGANAAGEGVFLCFFMGGLQNKGALKTLLAYLDVQAKSWMDEELFSMNGLKILIKTEN